MATQDSITLLELKDLLSYDSATGRFQYLQPPKRRSRTGAVGTVDVKGYGVVCIRYKHYKLHRLAWLYVYGQWPCEGLDHINGDKLDNRIENLREVPARINKQNFRTPTSANRSGFLGVSKSNNTSAKKWKVGVKTDGKAVHVGYFESPEEAYAAYVAAKRRLHEGCTI